MHDRADGPLNVSKLFADLRVLFAWDADGTRDKLDAAALRLFEDELLDGNKRSDGTLFEVWRRQPPEVPHQGAPE